MIQNQEMRLRLSSETISTAVIILFILFRSGSPFSIAYESLSGYIEIVLSVIIILKFSSGRINEKNNRAIVISVLFAICLFATMAFHGEFGSWKSYLVNSLLCVDGCLIICIAGTERVKYLWMKWMRLIVVLTLIFHVLLISGLTFFSTVETQKEFYYTLFLVSEMPNGRVSGFCWEPSMYAVILAFSLLFELKAQNRRKTIFIILYVVSLVLTKSMSAYVYLALIIFIESNDRIKSSFGRIFIFVLLVVACIVAFTYGDQLMNALYLKYPDVFGKFVNKDRSYLTRLYNPAGDFLVFIRSPIFGVGAENVEALVRAAVVHLKDGFINARTSTCTYFFAAYGLLPGIFANIPWISGCIRNAKHNFLSKIAMLVLCGYAFTSITLTSSQAFWILIFLMYFEASKTASIMEKDKCGY